MKLKAITIFILLNIFNLNIIYAQQLHTSSKKNISFFKKLALLFDKEHKSNKHYLARYEKTGNILHLEQYIGTPEMQQRQHAKNPFAYYIVKAIVVEQKEKGCKKEALWFYSAALQIEKERLQTMKDFDIVKAIEKLDKKYEKLGIKNHDNYSLWLQHKHDELYDCYKNGLEPEEDAVDSLLAEITKIEVSIKKEKMNIDSLGTLIKTLKKEKKSKLLEQQDFDRKIKMLKSKQDYQRFRLEVGKIETLQQEDFQKMEAIIKRNLAMPVKAASYEDSHAKFRFEYEDSSSGIDLETKGQASGRHCSDEMQQATQQILEVLLTEIKQHNSHIRQNLSVDLQIKGHADWHGAGKKTLISYEATDNIHENYTNQDGQERTFSIEAGEKRKIQNEELAFLRAYCAYQTALDVLGRNQLKINTVTFEAIEHFKMSEYDGSDGSDFRGIDLSITINNLFQQYEKLIKAEEHKASGVLQAIKGIQKQIDNIERTIRNKERWIVQQEKKVDRIWAEIDEKEEKIGYIKSIMENSDADKYINSEVAKIIANIKEDYTVFQSLKKREQKQYFRN